MPGRLADIAGASTADRPPVVPGSDDEQQCVRERGCEPVYADRTMAESSIEPLLRWEQHGAVWRARFSSDTEAVVDLCTCGGEPVDQLRFTDPAVLRYLADRPRSDA
jgi:hypothetical protein